MTIARIVKVPSDLPYAHLYLDDVEQICGILRDAVKAKWPEKPIETSFSTNALQMDSIEDLKIQGGSAREFNIKVAGLSVEMRSFSNPTIYLYSLDSESVWATYSKVKAIFDARQFTIKNTLTRLPFWFKGSIWAFGMFIFPLVFLALRTRWFVDATYWIAVAAVFFIMIRPSRVSFVRSHERSKGAIENRNGYIKAIILILVGAVIGKVVEIATSYWMKGH